ncbi:MAG: hypothetical protein HY301_00495 [Verrucomicrobia bacterium]|nr:hypothetical protein [Verrucomicrobiota bacterium]
MKLPNSTTRRAGTRKETVFAIFLTAFAVYLVFHVVKLTRSLATRPAPGPTTAAVVEEPSGPGAATSATNPVRVTSPLPTISAPASMPMPVTMATAPPPPASSLGVFMARTNALEVAGDAGGSAGAPPVMHLGSTRTFTIVYPSADYFDSNAVTIVLVPIDEDPTNAPPVAVPQSRRR